MYTISLPVTSKWVIFVTHAGGHGIDPHRIQTFNCDKSIVSEWCNNYTNNGDLYWTGGAYWCSQLNNTLEVYYMGEHIQSISNVPTVFPKEAQTWTVCIEYYDEDSYNMELDYITFPCEQDALAFMCKNSGSRMDLSRDLPNGSVPA